jgi:hypothetical protein
MRAHAKPIYLCLNSHLRGQASWRKIKDGWMDVLPLSFAEFGETSALSRCISIGKHNSELHLVFRN